MGARGPAPLMPCGTLAAYRRHLRYGQEPCFECKRANLRAWQDRKPAIAPGRYTADPRPLRNGLPETPAYAYRARVYPWAQRAIAAAEAIHGRPPEDEDAA